MTELTYSEEAFGILRDDDLVLDCMLVRPSQATDADLKAIRVWVPRYPLTKASVITCARQEVDALGSQGNVAHLVFDLHGTGDSEGVASDHDFDADLRAVRLWAEFSSHVVSPAYLLSSPAYLRMLCRQTMLVEREYLWCQREGTAVGDDVI